jgi:hypothetical protein
MQMKRIIVAVAATLVAGQAAAAAVTQAEIVAARTAGTLQETWVSGASAPTFNIFDGFALGCDDNTAHIFTNNATVGSGKPGSIGNINAYACKRGGIVSVLYHNVDGGSFNAYAPHLTGTAPDGSAMPLQLQRVKNLGTVVCTVSGTYTPDTVAPIVAPPYASSNSIPVEANCAKVNPVTAPDGAIVKPAGGFSDVEAKLWGIDVSAAGTEGDANVTQTFGVVVTPKLYRALQAAQGMSAAAIAADTTYDPALAPNITSAQYASIAQFGGGYQTDWSPLLGAAGTGKNVYLARRTATSGTQASSNAFFLENPCASGAPGGNLPPAKLADSTATFIVSEGSGTGNVKTTMTSINTAASGQNFAIGIVSAENNWRTEAAANEGYRFVKLDGVHPEGNGDTTFARNTAIKGDYNFVMEMKSFVANTADAFGAALIPTIAAALGNPADCADVPRGLSLNPAGGSSCTVGVEVAKGTKFGNNCSPVQLFF